MHPWAMGAIAAVTGLLFAAIASPLTVLVVVALAFVVSMAGRVRAVDGQRRAPRWATLAALFALFALYGQLVSWFGWIGGLIALVILAILVLVIGGDLS